MFISKLIASLAVVLILAALPSYGQEKFRPGYVITLQQDTLRGLIDYKTASKSAEKCRFRNSADSKVITYTPNQIAGYRFTPGKYYVAKSVEVDKQIKKVFLEYLIDGIADMFFFRDETGDHYLVENENNQLNPLTAETTEVIREGKTYNRRKEHYKGTLKYVFSDAPTLTDRIEVTDLNHVDLIGIAEAYHNQVCDEYECIVYSRQKTPIQIRFGIMGGSSTSRISFKNVEYLQSQMEAPFPNSANITFGAFVQFRDPFLSEHISFQTEAWYENSSYTTDELALSYSHFKVPAMIRYTSIHHKVKPTFAVGPVVTLLTDMEAKRISGDQTRSWFQGGNVLMGAEGAVGLNYEINNRNSVFLEARYNMTFGKHYNLNKFSRPSTPRGYIILQDNFNSKLTTINIVAGLSFLAK